MTIVAPKRTDFAMSPWVRIPPSAIIGFRAALAHQRKAANCQPPVPKASLNFSNTYFPGQSPLLVASAQAFSTIRERLLVFQHCPQ